MNLRLLFLMGIFCLIPFNHFSQNIEWVLSSGGTGADEVRAIDIDSDNNVISVGTFQGIVDFDPNGAGLLKTGLGSFDFFVSKHDNNGDLLWNRTFGSESFEIAYAIETDSEQNVILMGRFSSTIDFDPGADVFELTPEGAAWFILKLDSEGDFLWCHAIEGNDDFSVKGELAINSANGILMASQFSEDVDFDPSVGTAIETTDFSESKVFFASYNSDGDFEWVSAVGGDNISTVNGIDFDASDNLYVAGQFNGTVDFDPGVGTFEIENEVIEVNGYILKLHSDGALDWAKHLKGTSYNWYMDVAAKGTDEVVLTGGFEGTADFNLNEPTFNLNASWGATEGFVQKLTSTGSFLWAKPITGVETFTLGKTIETDEEGNTYFGGYFNGTVNFGDDENVVERTAVAGDIFIQKVDNDGELSWVYTFGGESTDQLEEIGLDSEGNLYAGGTFYVDIDFDGEAGEINVESAGENDFYTLKISQTTGLQNYSEDHNNLLKMYPNPAKEWVYVQATDTEMVEIIDQMGKVMYRSTTPNSGELIDLHQFESGIYLVVVSDDTSIRSEKLIVQ